MAPIPCLRAVAVCVITAALAWGWPPGASARAGECDLAHGPRHTVAGVIDGETLRLDDGREVKLAGALAPRRPDDAAGEAPWPPADAARERLHELAFGRTVELRPDSAVIDRHGRTLAQVFLVHEGRLVWLQGHMIELGLARAHATPAQQDCIPALVALEVIARGKSLGLWRLAAYRVRDAEAGDELQRLEHTFQIVEGLVRRVVSQRAETIISLGADPRRGFALVVAGRDRRGLESAGATLKSLAGRRVRVRGWIEMRTGTIMRITHRGQIELLDAPPEAAATPPERSGNKKRPASRKPDARDL